MIKEKEIFKERRKSQRVKCDFNIEFEYQDSNVTARVINISSSGMYMESNYSIPLFREISIGIKLPGIEKLIECVGVVVRSEKIQGKDRYNVAIFFEDIEPLDKQKLAEYVEKKLVS